VCVDLSTGSPQRIPDEFMQAARCYIADTPGERG
jgi:acyl-CoA thioesterase FadM